MISATHKIASLDANKNYIGLGANFFKVCCNSYWIQKWLICRKMLIAKVATIELNLLRQFLI